jgi:hypothetical protein
MSVRRAVTLIAVSVALLVALLVNALTAAAAKDYRAEQFHARIVVEPGGSIVVTETLRIVFGSGSFTRVFRDLPSRRTDGVTVLGATMDGQALERGRTSGQFEIRKEDDGVRRVVWHFSETSNATRTFTLTYRAAGVARQDAEVDVLAWTLLPRKHEYLIACGSAEIVYPENTILAGAPSFDPPASESQIEGRAVRALRCPFERDQSWVATLHFAPRSLVPVAPAWQQRAQLTREHLPLFLGLAGLILLAGAGGFVIFGLTHRPARPADRDLRVAAFPDTLPPALAGTLLRPGASAAWADVLGGILDLARRGVVRIEAQAPGGVFRRQEVRITPGEIPGALLSHERALLDLLFMAKSGSRSIVTFSELARTVASTRQWKRMRNAVSDDLRTAGLIDPERERTRRRVTFIGIGILVLAFVGFPLSVIVMNRVGDSVLALPMAVLAAGIAGLVTGVTLSPLSEEGVRRGSQWRAFRRHLADVADQARTSTASRAELGRWLPHAAALGTAVTWVKRLEKQGVAEGPSWLAAVVRDGETGPASMASMVAVLSAGTHAGAHAGGSAHGGAGAAGGGASGAA